MLGFRPLLYRTRPGNPHNNEMNVWITSHLEEYDEGYGKLMYVWIIMTYWVYIVILVRPCHLRQVITLFPPNTSGKFQTSDAQLARKEIFNMFSANSSTETCLSSPKNIKGSFSSLAWYFTNGNTCLWWYLNILGELHQNQALSLAITGLGNGLLQACHKQRPEPKFWP